MCASVRNLQGLKTNLALAFVVFIGSARSVANCSLFIHLVEICARDGILASTRDVRPEIQPLGSQMKEIQYELEYRSRQLAAA